MNKKMLKGLIVVAMVLAIAVPALISAPSASAQINFGLNYANQTGLANTDPRQIAANVINIALACLGILAVVIILVGGFKWMTAGGNEEQVEEAKKILVAGVIGLVIILASWGIATFVLNSLLHATGLNQQV
jgi:hypothetical protein